MELKKFFVLMLAVNLFYIMLIFMILVAEVVPEEGRWVRFLTIEELFCPRKYFEKEDIYASSG